MGPGVAFLMPALLAFAGGMPAPATDAAPPLAFVANAGQSDRRVRFLAQGGGYSLFFTARGVTLASGQGLALKLDFAGANRHPRIAGSRRGGTVSYIGKRVGLPSFGELTYRALWPGIDLTFRGERGRLKYEFRVAPGADPRAIRLAYRGARR